MAQATPNLPQLTAKQQFAVPILAMQAARNAVKRKLQAQGIGVSLTPAAPITRLAEDYAITHRDELLPQAILRAQQIYPSPSAG